MSNSWPETCASQAMRAPKLLANGSFQFIYSTRLILFGEKAMRNAVEQYLAHYHAERPHQGLGNELIEPLEPPPDTGTKIETTERLGGLLRSYRRAA